MNEAKLLLVLLAIGSEPIEITNHLEGLITDQAHEVMLGDDGVDCRTEVKVVDFMETDQGPLIVDFEAYRDTQIHGCYPEAQFCRAKFIGDKMEVLNCRDI
jgi:hypothetical protein